MITDHHTESSHRWLEKKNYNVPEFSNIWQGVIQLVNEAKKMWTKGHKNNFSCYLCSVKIFRASLIILTTFNVEESIRQIYRNILKGVWVTPLPTKAWKPAWSVKSEMCTIHPGANVFCRRYETDEVAAGDKDEQAVALYQQLQHLKTFC